VNIDALLQREGELQHRLCVSLVQDSTSLTRAKYRFYSGWIYNGYQSSDAKTKARDGRSRFAWSLMFVSSLTSFTAISGGWVERHGGRGLVCSW